MRGKHGISEPNKDGFYGKFGGRFGPRNMMTSSFGVEKRPTVKVRQTQVSKRN